VSVKQDETAEDMKESVHEFSKETHYDMVMVVVMSHGNDGCTLGTDSKEVYDIDLLTMFNNEVAILSNYFPS
jgi:hypothetical protein